MANEVVIVVKGDDRVDLKPIEQKTDSFLDGVKRKSAEATAETERLRKKLIETGDETLFKDLTKAEANVRRWKKLHEDALTSLSKKTEDEGEEAGAGWGLRFIAKVGPVMANAPISPHLIGAAASAAPAIASLMSAAVTGGVAAAPIGAGIAIAFRDPKVKAEARALGISAMDVLTRASGSFIEETRQGIGIFRSGIESSEQRLESIFDKASKFVVPIADAFSEGSQEFLESVDVVVGNAGPVIEVFRDHIPKALDSTGEALETLSKNAEFNADTLSAALTSVEFSIEHAANGINLLSEVGKISAVGALIDMTDGFRGTDDAATGAAHAYKDAAMELKAYSDEVKAQTDPAFALIKAQQGLKESQNEYNEAVKEHGRNSPEARAALLDLAEASIELSSAVAGAEGTFNGKLSPALRATLRAAGLTEKEIRELEKQFGQARKAGDQFAKTYTANVVVRYREVGRAVPIYGEYQSGIGGRAHGGIQGAQNGQMSSGLTMVGEHGRELLDLPPGTQVHSNPDTERLLGGMGGRTVLEVRVIPGADDVMNVLAQNLQFRVRTEAGGDAQAYWGG